MPNLEEPTTWAGDPGAAPPGVVDGTVGEGGADVAGAGDNPGSGDEGEADGEDRQAVVRTMERINTMEKPGWRSTIPL